MPANRFYLKCPLTKGSEVLIEGKECNHLKYVMRKKEGEKVELFDGTGFLAQAEIVKIEKGKITLFLLEVVYSKPAVLPLTLVQALPTPSHLKFIIQKGTELGVSSFYLFPSAHSQKRILYSDQIERLKQISIEAAKQCGRLDLPKIYLAPSLERLELPEGNAYFGDPKGAAPLPQGLSPYLLFIGPEKGFTEQEQSTIKTHFRAQGVRLHPYTLRAETAAIVAITLALQKA